MVKFVYDLYTEKQADVIVFGVPLGLNSTKTLNSLREVSQEVEPFDLRQRRNLLQNVKLADVGNLKIKANDLDAIFRKAASIRQQGKIPLILGGNHLLTLYALGIVDEETRVVVWDAHFDLKDVEDGERFAPATWLRRFYEVSGHEHILVLGVRACDEDELNFIHTHNIRYFTSQQIKEEREKVKKEFAKFVGNKPVYLSIDMDVFDPSIAPAVAYPEPEGISFSDFLQLLSFVKNIVGIDVVEIKSLPSNRITEFLAIHVIFHLLGQV
jgi:agmatinase